MLQISSYWSADEPMRIDLLPGRESAAELLAAKTTDRRQIGNLLAEWMPARLGHAWLDTHELSSATMMSERVAGLYFIGEAVNDTGWLGGYNFQWAWASGVAAGRAAADFAQTGA